MTEEKIYGKLQVNDWLQWGYTSCVVFSPNRTNVIIV